MLGQQSKVGGVESSDQNALAGIDSLCIFDMIPWLVCIRVPYKDYKTDRQKLICMLFGGIAIRSFTSCSAF